MNIQGLFSLAQSFADVILWILVISSIVSVAMILERFFVLSKVSKQNKAFRAQANELIQSQDLSKLDSLSQENGSLAQKALSFGMRHAKANGEKGLDEIFSSFKKNEKTNK